MPNWCANNVILTHEDASMIKRAKDAFDNHSFLSEFKPCPKELHETLAGFCGEGTYAQELLEFKEKLNFKWFGYKNWYDWQVSNWGTKWDIGGENSGFSNLQSDNELWLNFDSAWSPPIDFYPTLVELGFNVKAYYYESGCAFCGIWEDGIDDQYGIDGNAKWVTENIPAELDAEFCISNNMAEWECSELDEKIHELILKIEGEGCEETCNKYRKEIEELRAELSELEELIND
jgi:hypothetical protein